MGYEYKVVPAPAKGVKAKGVKTAEARFALAFEQQMNALAADGWDYVRSDTMPSEERQGLTGSQTVWRTLLVFRRVVAAEVEEPVALLPEPEPEPELAVAPEDSQEVEAAEPEFEEGDEETRPA